MATNRLGKEKSPYLLQHAHNPVDWYPWGEEAFAKARAENRLIFLSVGYSTCHWCHVMERESFENPETAQLMNDLFVNVKVDREERPDVDRVYMTFVQSATGRGGWPMSVWLTPSLAPVVGGTYFPPRDTQGHPGFPDILRAIAGAWAEQPERMIDQGNRIIEALRSHAEALGKGGQTLPDQTAPAHAFHQMLSSFDETYGGFGNAPKFPRPVSIRFLLDFAELTGRDSREGREAIRMADATLSAMAAGGMADQLGGGFHRYSVDRFWHVPHFEKMLYDQAQLAVAYLELYQITNNPAHAVTARATLDYTLREMRDPTGGFHSAEDADSAPEPGAEKTEGAYYVWSEPEIRKLLPADLAEAFLLAYGVRTEGNIPDGSDPHGELEGKNVLIRALNGAEVAKRTGTTPEEASKSLAAARATLLDARANRPRPHRDDKILTSWNGLMIGALARAALILDEPIYREAAILAAGFVRNELWRPAEKKLLRSWRNGPSDIPGFADDYAFLIDGLIALYEATGDGSWIAWALELQAVLDASFAAPDGGYYASSGNDPNLLVRMKEDHDGAEPAASSVAAKNLLRLGRITGDADFLARAEKTLAGFARVLEEVPLAMPAMLSALALRLADPIQIVLRGNASARHAFERLLAKRFMPWRTLLFASDPDDPVVKNSPLLAEIARASTEPAAFLCRESTCSPPATTPEGLEALLA